MAEDLSSRRKVSTTAAGAGDVALAADADDEWGKELVNWLFPAYVTLIVISVLAFLTKATMTRGQEMSLDRAVLTVVNAATCTGLPQSLSSNSIKPPGQVLILLLTLAGSMFSMVVGGLAVRRILRLPYSDKQIIAAAAVCEVGALMVGGAGLCGISPSFFGGLTQGVGAFGNSGMMIGKPFAVTAWQTHFIVLPMAFLGGLGITVLLELRDLLLHAKPMSHHARVVLRMSVGLYFFATVAFVLLRWIAADFNFASGTAAETIASSSAAALNTRTAGIGVEYAYLWPRSMQWVAIVLMVIGASPAGTGGGLKTTTVATLFAGGRRSLRGEAPGRVCGIAMSWLGMYLGMALVGLLMLLMTEPQTATDRVVFLAVSALGNVGLAPDQLSISIKGTYVLAALMLAGRMVPLLVLWWMADTTFDADVAVG